MVKGLEAGFATGVNLALVGWIEGVALDHLGAAFHDPNDDTLARGTGSTEAGVPVIASSD